MIKEKYKEIGINFMGEFKSSGGLTDDEFAFIAGKRAQILGKIQERQDIVKKEAVKQLTEWQKRNSDLRWDE